MFKKDFQIIIHPKISWNPVDPNSDAIYIDNLIDTTLNQFVFKVEGVNSDSGVDTIRISKKDIENGGRKTIRTETGLYMEHPITINQVEELLKLQGISNHSLKEKLYWMCKLTYGKIQVNKNEYGDIISYGVKSRNEYIPSNYYSISTKSMEINALDINLGTLEHTGNFIKYSLTICNPSVLSGDFNNVDKALIGNSVLQDIGNYNDLALDFYCGVLGNITAIDFGDSELGIKPAPSHKIYLAIWVSGNLYVANHNGKYLCETFPKFFPFSYHSAYIKRSN